MKVVLVLIFGSAFCFTFNRATAQTTECSVKCNLDDEFYDPDDPVKGSTDEWNEFTEKLDEATFKNYTRTCTDTDNILIINQDDQFLWDLRFKLYSERVDKSENTISNCLCTITDCGEPFQTCMKNVREAMTSDLETWQNEIATELENRCTTIV